MHGGHQAILAFPSQHIPVPGGISSSPRFLRAAACSLRCLTLSCSAGPGCGDGDIIVAEITRLWLHSSLELPPELADRQLDFHQVYYKDDWVPDLLGWQNAT